jgi:hypothetical protein
MASSETTRVEPPEPFWIESLMRFDLFERGREYTYEEVVALVKKADAAGIKKDYSLVDASALADCAAEYSRWEIERDTRDLKEKLKTAASDSVMRSAYRDIALGDEEQILGSYSNIVRVYRGLEWDAVYDSKTINSATKLKLMDAEAALAEAIREFKERYPKFYVGTERSAEAVVSDSIDVEPVAEFRAELGEVEASQRRTKEVREAAPNKRSCLLLIAPAVIFIGALVAGSISLLG